jgi:VWFA-related protein
MSCFIGKKTYHAAGAKISGMRIPQLARIAFGLTLMTAGALAQTPPQDGPPQTTTPPVFRAEVESVEVDAIVTDRDGRFVRTLTKDDFEVYQDGKRQPIALVTLIEHSVPGPLAPAPAIPADPDVATNANANEGRIYVLVLDGLHIAAENKEKAVAATRLFVEQYLGDTDMMAVLHIGGTAPYSQDLTRSRARLLNSIDKFKAGNMLPSESSSIAETSAATQQTTTNDDGTTTTASLLVADLYQEERAYATTQTLNALQQISTRLGTVRGRRKSLIFISEGFISPRTTSDSNDALAALEASRTRALADSIEISLQDAARAATLNDVTIYTVDPRGLMPNGGRADSIVDTSDSYIAQAAENARQIQSMRDVAVLTGGTAIVNTNNIAAGLKRVVAENSAYYVLAFTPTPMPRDGKVHKLEVRVRQKGLNVKSRRGYLAASGTPTPPPNPKSGMSVATYEAMRRPVPTTGLNLSLFAAAFRKDAKVASVLIGTELQGRELNLANNAPLEVSYALVDNTGRLRASRTLNINANLRAETRTRAEEGGLRVLQRFDVPPGRYQVRVAANQPGSATGSVVHDLDVPDFSTTLGVSSVVLTSRAAAAAATIVGDPDLRTALPDPPGATRTFSADDVVSVLAEVYDNRQTPGTLLVNAAITTPNGDVIRKVPAAKQSDDAPRYTVSLPIDGISPGKYVLVVDARASETAPPVLAPPVPFTVK